MSLIRVFVALPISPEVKERIAQSIDKLKKQLPGPVRWVAVENIHVTLKFLGDTSQASLQDLTHTLSAVIGQQAPIQITIGGFGVYPNTKRPRVLWVGIQAPPELESLQRAIETACTRLGYPAEDKSFSPHLTIARIREDSPMTDLRPVLQNIQIGELGTLKIETVTLFRSDLFPKGPKYTPLAHIPLAQNRNIHEVNPESA